MRSHLCHVDLQVQLVVDGSTDVPPNGADLCLKKSESDSLEKIDLKEGKIPATRKSQRWCTAQRTHQCGHHVEGPGGVGFLIRYLVQLTLRAARFRTNRHLRKLATKHKVPKLIGRFNFSARRTASFSEEEISILKLINSAEVH
jgi:hypothetical protein